jgi:hypothetical protein
MKIVTLLDPEKDLPACIGAVRSVFTSYRSPPPPSEGKSITRALKIEQIQNSLNHSNQQRYVMHKIRLRYIKKLWIPTRITFSYEIY